MMRLVAALVAWLVLAAPALAAPVEIELWTTDRAPERLAAYRYIADGFEAFNPGTRIAIRSFDENGFVGRLRARPGPAIVNTGSDLVLAAAAEDLLDTEAATRVIASIDPGRFFAGARDAFGDRGRGGFLAVPFHGWIQGVWYRADWFAEQGLPPPDTPAALLAAAERLNDPAKGRWGIVLPEGGDVYSQQIFGQLAAAYGMRLFGPDGDMLLDRPATREALALYAALARHSPPGLRGTRGRDYFIQGRAAMMFYSTFIMDDIAVAAAARDTLIGGRFPDLPGAAFDPSLVFNTGVVTVIRGAEAVSMGSVNGLAIAAGLDPAVRDAAERFVAWLHTPDVYIAWLHAAPGGMLPVVRGVARTPAFLREPTGTFRRFGAAKLEELVAGFESVRLFTNEGGRASFGAATVFSQLVIGRMIERVVLGRDSPEQSVRTAADDIRQLLNQ